MPVRTTGIGSLPFQTIEEAFEYSFSHDLPFFPQLLHIHGNMIQQLKNCNFKHLDRFIDLAKEKKISEIKIQIAGPNTSRQDFKTYKETISYLSNLIRELNPIFFLDEPILEAKEPLIPIIGLLKENEFKVGIHCCNQISEKMVDMVSNINIDIFSYDSILNPSIENNFNNIELALGCVSTQTSEKSRVSKENVSLISATCGLALSKRDPSIILSDLNSLRDNL